MRSAAPKMKNLKYVLTTNAHSKGSAAMVHSQLKIYLKQNVNKLKIRIL